MKIVGGGTTGVDPNPAEIQRLDRELAATKALLVKVTAVRDDLYTSIERILPVYEATKEWHRARSSRPIDQNGPDYVLERTIERAVAAEPSAVSS